MLVLLVPPRRHDTQHNDTQHNDIQNNATQHKLYSALQCSVIMLSDVMLSVAFFYNYAECHYAGDRLGYSATIPR
jgi:hypothetical protein